MKDAQWVRGAWVTLESPEHRDTRSFYPCVPRISCSEEDGEDAEEEDEEDEEDGKDAEEEDEEDEEEEEEDEGKDDEEDEEDGKDADEDADDDEGAENTSRNLKEAENVRKEGPSGARPKTKGAARYSGKGKGTSGNKGGKHSGKGTGLTTVEAAALMDNARLVSVEKGKKGKEGKEGGTQADVDTEAELAEAVELARKAVERHAEAKKAVERHAAAKKAVDERRRRLQQEEDVVRTIAVAVLGLSFGDPLRLR